MTKFITQFIKQQKMNTELIPIHYLHQYSDQVWVVGVGFFYNSNKSTNKMQQFYKFIT